MMIVTIIDWVLGEIWMFSLLLTDRRLGKFMTELSEASFFVFY